MSVRPDARSAPRPPVEVRPARHDDLTAVREVTRAAFGADGDHVVALLDELVDDTGPAPPLRASLVAVADGPEDGVVGHVALSRGWVDAARQLVEMAVLSPLSVRPDQQGRGVGRALVGAALTEAERLGMPLVMLEGDPRYYSRLGFEPAAEHHLGSPSARIPGPACQVRLLSAYQPWMTGALVYPEVFWRLDCVGLRDSVPGR